MCKVKLLGRDGRAIGTATLLPSGGVLIETGHGSYPIRSPDDLRGFARSADGHAVADVANEVAAFQERHATLQDLDDSVASLNRTFTATEARHAYATVSSADKAAGPGDAFAMLVLLVLSVPASRVRNWFRFRG